MTRGGAGALLAALLLASAASAARLPPPGSYALNRIEPVPAARLIDAAGASVELSSVTRGAVTALAFFYAQCRDPQGCPVAWSTFETARGEAAADPLLKNRLRLVFISLDPEHDRPATMRLLQDGEGRSAVPWLFLTGSSAADIAPLLTKMGQDASAETDAAGRRTGVVNHMLKVFLIDPDGMVREIYTTAFLTPESLLNDARTLALACPQAKNDAAP